VKPDGVSPSHVLIDPAARAGFYHPFLCNDSRMRSSPPVEEYPKGEVVFYKHKISGT